MKHQRLIQAVWNQPWAIEPAKFAEILAFVRERLAGVELTPQEIRARLNGDPPGPRRSQRTGRLAIIPIAGVLAPHASLLTEASGGTSLDGIRRDVQAALSDPEVGTILLAIDSPGGNVSGVTETAQVIRQGRATKPIIAAVDPLAASAAYWLASQASEIVITPSGFAGSVGVLAVHEDLSEQQRMEGIATTLVTSSAYKAEANPFSPLSAEARAELQRNVNQVHRRFVTDVAEGRRSTVATVDEHFGQGRMLDADRALRAGLVDAIASFDQVLERLHAGEPTLRATSSRTAIAAALPPHVQRDLAAKRLALLTASYGR